MLNEHENSLVFEDDVVFQYDWIRKFYTCLTDIENDEKETSKIIRAISKNVYLDNEAKQQYIK